MGNFASQANIEIYTEKEEKRGTVKCYVLCPRIFMMVYNAILYFELHLNWFQGKDILLDVIVRKTHGY